MITYTLLGGINQNSSFITLNAVFAPKGVVCKKLNIRLNKGE